MSPRLRSGLLSLGVLVIGAIVFVGIGRVLERQRTADEINRLRDELYRARVASDRCRGSLQTSESSLRVLTGTIDSMRTEIERLETLDDRGVPADEYPGYLELFESYNDSVTSWEARERRLRAAEGSCRATIESHNALSDSLQSALTAAGISPT